MVLASACGSGGDGGGTSPDDHDYSIIISTSTSTLAFPAGGSGTVTITITRGGGFTGTVSLAAEGLPAYATGSFSPATLTGTATTSTLTLHVDAAASPATYRFTVRASASGVGDALSYPIDCTITAPVGFTLAPTSSTIGMIQGVSGTVGIGITRTGGFTGAITLALEGAPAGITGSFDPNPAPGTQATLTVTAQPTTATGTYPLTIRGTATGAPERTTTVTLTVYDASIAGFTLSLSTGSLAIAKGGSGTVIVTITRSGGFTGPVTLASEGHPTGVTPIFDANPATGNTSNLLLEVSSQVPAGAYPITIRGEAAGLTRRVTLDLRVEEGSGFSVALAPASVTLAPGTSAQVVTVTINRTGGFAGEVALSATGVPANVTGTFSPQSTTGSSAQWTLTAAAGAAPGNSTVTVHGTATGMTEQTANLALTVVAAGTSMTWRFCAPNAAPAFFAYQDGVSAFVAVPPAGDGSYTMSMAAARGAVVFVQPGLPTLPEAPAFRTISRSPQRATSSGYTTTVLYATNAELQALSQSYCPSPVNTKTLSGAVANIVGDVYLVALGGGLFIGLDATAVNYLLTKVQDGPRDLVAGSARMVGEGAEPTRLIIRRDINLANGSTIPLLDFGSTEAFATASAILTFAGLASGTSSEVMLGFATANGTATLIGSLEAQPAASRTWFGIPDTRTRAGDLHAIEVHAFLDNRDFYATLFSRDVGARTITFAPEAPLPNVGVLATTPVTRLRAAGTCGAPGSALSGVTTATYSQSDRAWTLSETAAYLGASPNYDLRTLALTGLTGWNEFLFGVQSGSQVQWYVECNGGGGSVATDGTLVQWLDFKGTLVP
jgi:uncharacterized membrane protein